MEAFFRDHSAGKLLFGNCRRVKKAISGRTSASGTHPGGSTCTVGALNSRGISKLQFGTLFVTFGPAVVELEAVK